MSVSEKLKQSLTKLSNIKLNVIWIDKLLRFRIYHQEILGNIIF